MQQRAGSVEANQIVDLRGLAMSVTKEKPSEAFKNFDASWNSESGGAHSFPDARLGHPLPRCQWSSLRVLLHAEFLDHQIVHKLRGYA
jgi:hypothetical protein